VTKQLRDAQEASVSLYDPEQISVSDAAQTLSCHRMANIRPSRYCRTHGVAVSPRAMFIFGHQGDPVRSLVLRESCIMA
jgi:hypothetical protein